MLEKPIQQYLDRYAEQHILTASELIADSCCEPFAYAVVIPCFDEGGAFIDRLLNLESNNSTLIVLVLNAPESASTQQRTNTLATYSTLIARSLLLKQDAPAGISLHQENGKSILCLNLIQSALPQWHQSGVGFARKLGMDICLQLFANKQLCSPLVRNTDADVIWPATYLTDNFPEDAGISAYLYPFIHDTESIADPLQKTHATLYDKWLRYYVAGLSWAESPWAFHTVGSTMIINLRHYAINRGFPKLVAGEDFYLLNKLAKTGRIINLTSPQLTLSARLSSRTPFGTGSSITKLVEGKTVDWRFYHPEIFNQLKFWQQQINTREPFLELGFPAQYQPIKNALRHFNLDKLLAHSKQHSKTTSGFRQHLKSGFDANKTRRTVHWLRDHYYPSISFEELLIVARQDYEHLFKYIELM